MTNTAHYFDLATIISFLVGTGLPVIVGRITNARTHPALKGAALLLLAGVTGVLSQWLDALNSHTPFAWEPVVLSALGAFVVAQASHSGILKYTPLTNTVTSVSGLDDTDLGTGVIGDQESTEVVAPAKAPAPVAAVPPAPTA